MSEPHITAIGLLMTVGAVAARVRTVAKAVTTPEAPPPKEGDDK